MPITLFSHFYLNKHMNQKLRKGIPSHVADLLPKEGALTTAATWATPGHVLPHLRSERIEMNDEEAANMAGVVHGVRAVPGQTAEEPIWICHKVAGRTMGC